MNAKFLGAPLVAVAVLVVSASAQDALSEQSAKSGFTIPRAWSHNLAGPWSFEPGTIIPPGADDAFDAKHTDAVSGYYFAERKEFLYFYIGYPARAQPRKKSPFGSAQAVATQKLGEKSATKRGVV